MEPWTILKPQTKNTEVDVYTRGYGVAFYFHPPPPVCPLCFITTLRLSGKN